DPAEGHRTGGRRIPTGRQRTQRSPPAGRAPRQAARALAWGGRVRVRAMRAGAGAGSGSAAIAGGRAGGLAGLAPVPAGPRRIARNRRARRRNARMRAGGGAGRRLVAAGSHATGRGRFRRLAPGAAGAAHRDRGDRGDRRAAVAVRRLVAGESRARRAPTPGQAYSATIDSSCSRSGTSARSSLSVTSACTPVGSADASEDSVTSAAAATVTSRGKPC